ncbi:MAG: DUF4192 domain-containing protein [Desulfatitalea sp.]
MNDRRHPGDHPDRSQDAQRPPDTPGHTTDRATEIVKLRGADHLITAVTFLLGYQPAEPSLVVVGVLGRRLVLTARIDLPELTDLDDPQDLAGAWEMFTRPLDTSGADAVAAIAYADNKWTPALREFADAAPLPVLDLLRVHEGRWWALDCPTDRCGHPSCSPDGAPVTDHTEIAAPMIANGSAIPGARADLAASLQPGPAEIVDQVAERLRIQPVRSRETLYQAVCEAHDARTGGPDPITPGQAAILLTALTDVHVRDACMTWTDPAGWWLWHDLIAVAPPGHVAPVAMLIAVVAYQRGDGVMAAIATEHALTDRPGYGLARLVQASLHHALPPEAITTLITEALAEHPLTVPTGPRHDSDTTTPAGPTDGPPIPSDPADRDHTDD